ncbi:MAG: SDR family oxidoreductase [Pseudomonadota bacterium]|nr:SDR family oxidoreductase [Pseudomonadota bacterium]
MKNFGTLFCFGLGYSAMALSRRLDAEGWTIRGTCQNMERRNALAALGIKAEVFDGKRRMGSLSVLQNSTHVLLSIPPSLEGDPALRYHAKDIADIGSVRWVGYLSTTGVYGNHNGNWVDESSILKPTSLRSKQRVSAEKGWRNWGRKTKISTQIFRLAGIYGPGRSVLDRIKAGTAVRVSKPGQYFSRIHVEDLATVLSASINKPEPDAVYNVCDDEPADPASVTAYAFNLLGRTPPTEIALNDAELSPMAKTFWHDNKRVRNNKIKEQLGVELAFPNYRSGLRNLLSS